MNCPCPCHQMPEIKADCGNCNNTGILRDESLPRKKEDMIHIDNKPIFTKEAVDLSESKTILELDSDSL